VRILISNDDGIRATGIAALERTLEGLGHLDVVAPDRERSAAGHSLTLTQPLRVARLDDRHWAVSGTPTDAVMLAIETLLPERPDWIVSGINHGANMGEDVTYSGTVAAAMEGAILGIPAIAVSLAGRGELLFDEIQAPLRVLIERLVRFPLARNQLLNINLPNRRGAEIRGVRATRLGSRVYHNAVVARQDPQGRDYYWIGGTGPQWADDERSDAHAVAQGYISVTPLSADLTHYQALVDLEAHFDRWP
jgi:5'-nucleotidase